MIPGSSVAVVSAPDRQQIAQDAAAALTRAAYRVHNWVLSTDSEAEISAIAEQAAALRVEALVTLVPIRDGQDVECMRALVRAMCAAATARGYEMAGWVYTDAADDGTEHPLPEIARETGIIYEQALIPAAARDHDADRSSEWLPVLVALGPPTPSADRATSTFFDGR